MKNIKDLSTEELMTIDGGGWGVFTIDGIVNFTYNSASFVWGVVEGIGNGVNDAIEVHMNK